jgi:hypothetical protein
VASPETFGYTIVDKKEKYESEVLAVSYNADGRHDDRDNYQRQEFDLGGTKPRCYK